MTVYLDLTEVLAIHDTIIRETGGGIGMFDFPLLHSSIERPKATFGGKELYPSIFDKAAAIIHSLILNHPFHDGNKRTGLACAIRFLYLNGYTIQAANNTIIRFAMDIQSKKLNFEEISFWLSKHSRRKR